MAAEKKNQSNSMKFTRINGECWPTNNLFDWLNDDLILCAWDAAAFEGFFVMIASNTSQKVSIFLKRNFIRLWQLFRSTAWVLDKEELLKRFVPFLTCDSKMISTKIYIIQEKMNGCHFIQNVLSWKIKWEMTCWVFSSWSVVVTLGFFFLYCISVFFYENQSKIKVKMNKNPLYTRNRFGTTKQKIMDIMYIFFIVVVRILIDIPYFCVILFDVLVGFLSIK